MRSVPIPLPRVHATTEAARRGLVSPSARRARVGLALVFLTVGWSNPNLTAAVPLPTYGVYARFIVNLTRFIKWPETAFTAPNSPFLIGTFSRDPINPALKSAIREAKVNGHPVQIVSLDTIDDLQRCHLVYIAGDFPRLKAVMPRLVRRPILTVSDAAGFLELGGHVQFVPQPAAKTLRLTVSAENLKKSGLAAEAQLLRLAASETPVP